MSDEPRNQSESPVIQGFALGDFQTNCYLVTRGSPERGKRAWIVDCGYDPEPLLDAAQAQGLVIELIVLTHAHADHIAGLFEARKRFPDAPIVMHESERSWLADPMLNVSAAIGLNITAPDADRFIGHGDAIELDGMVFEVRHTPGHSPGSVSLIHAGSKQALVGDTLFNGSIGRTDLPGGDHPTLERSIKAQLYTLDPETVCYPGHGPATLVGREMVTNPFVRG